MEIDVACKLFCLFAAVLALRIILLKVLRELNLRLALAALCSAVFSVRPKPAAMREIWRCICP